MCLRGEWEQVVEVEISHIDAVQLCVPHIFGEVVTALLGEGLIDLE